jgi:flagellar basal-body rod modification protein FlgD
VKGKKKMSNVNSVTSGVSETVGKSSSRPAPSKDNNLDISDFMKLLIAQMSNQDPMGGSSESGGSGTDYIAQLAQFTMLQQLSTLSSNMSSSQAYNLIGKYVYLRESAGSELTYGKVDGVIKENGINYLMIGGESYDMSKVYAVANEDENIAGVGDDQVLRSAYLIGKQVTAKVTGTDGTVTTVSGIVEKLKIQDSAIYLVIGGKDVDLGNITEIAGEPAQQTTNI